MPLTRYMIRRMEEEYILKKKTIILECKFLGLVFILSSLACM